MAAGSDVRHCSREKVLRLSQSQEAARLQPQTHFVQLQREAPMNYRRLGDAGMKLSEIGLGGWLTFGNAVEMEQGRRIIDKAFEVGINFFDNSDAYAAGRCEEAWGELLKNKRRESYVLATKVFFP